MKEMRLKARAKINLGLDVLGKREDGYHEVRMIMHTINLYDKITIRLTKDPRIQILTNMRFLPANEDNLAYKAAKLLMDEFGANHGVVIELNKYIPIAAGMAGGSADAAAVMVGINKLFEFGLSRQELMERSVKIGADVPFCIMRGTALAEGLGEKLTPLPSLPESYILIAKPAVRVSTKFVYSNLNVGGLHEHPRIDQQIEALKQGDLKEVAAQMGNVLETVTIPQYPVIAQIKEQMMEQGALNAMMSGSGPTVFGLFDEEAKARAAYEILRSGEDAKQVYLLYERGQEQREHG